MNGLVHDANNGRNGSHGAVAAAGDGSAYSDSTAAATRALRQEVTTLRQQLRDMVSEKVPLPANPLNPKPI